MALIVDQLMRWFFLLTALTFPLYAVDFWRIPVWIFQIPWPAITVSAAVLLGVCARWALQRPVFPDSELATYRALFWIFGLFWVWHVGLSYRSEQSLLAFKEVIKLLWGCLVVGSAVVLFPRERPFLHRFFVVLLWSSTLLVLRLIYQYNVVFHAPFLGKEMGYPLRSGKNQLAWYLSLVVPWAVFYFWKVRAKAVTWVPLFVLLFAVIYVQSRAAWIGLLLGFVYVVGSAFRSNRRVGWKMTCAGLAGAVVFAGILGFGVSRFIDLSEIPLRAVSIVRPHVVPAEHQNLGRFSYQVRGQMAIDTLRVFAREPWIGAGLADTPIVLPSIPYTHNDHLGLMLELGIFAEILFLILLVLLWKRLRFSSEEDIECLPWMAYAGRMALVVLCVSTLFTNGYTSPIFWQFMLLMFLSVDTERGCVSEVVPLAPIPPVPQQAKNVLYG